MNKRGQDLTIGTLILIVLGVVVLVLLIVGFTKGFDFLFGKFDNAPGGKLQTIASSCSFAAEAGLKADYCADFKELSDENYVNCEYEQLQEFIDTKLAGGCGSVGGNVAVDTYCNELAGDIEDYRIDVEGSSTCPQGYDLKGKVNDKLCCVAKPTSTTTG